MQALSTPKDVIEALGGRDKVRSELNVGGSAISNWIKDGFPPKRILAIVEMAGRIGVPAVTLPVLLSMEAKYQPRQTHSSKEGM